jgi:hypothetical protein
LICTSDERERGEKRDQCSMLQRSKREDGRERYRGKRKGTRERQTNDKHLF